MVAPGQNKDTYLTNYFNLRVCPSVQGRPTLEKSCTRLKRTLHSAEAEGGVYLVQNKLYLWHCALCKGRLVLQSDF